MTINQPEDLTARWAAEWLDSIAAGSNMMSQRLVAASVKPFEVVC